MTHALFRERLDARATPAQLLRVFRDQPGLVALIGGWNGGASIIGFDPTRTLGPDEDPFEAVGQLPAVDAAEPGLFGGGWVGAIGYRLCTRLERLPPSPPRPVPIPDFSLAYYDNVLVLRRDGWWFEALTDPGDSERVERALTHVRSLVCTASEPMPYHCADLRPHPGAAGHRRAVERTLDHLAAGDLFQANVCRRFEAAFCGDPLDAFCAGVERLLPRYAAFLRTSYGAIASFSPELFLRRQGRRVITSPIKGTAPLGTDVADLVASAKDHAENVMIVDLMRNDLGRVCRPGSVRVEDLARPEQHTGVWHLVSDVVGELADGADDADLLRATFPPGSVTGAPKIRALEVIHEVEVTGRETYTGAIGYVSPCAGLELNVAIRTLEFAAGRIWLGAGGGVVIESTPEGELRETVVKAAPIAEAIGAHLTLEPAEANAPARPSPARARQPGGARLLPAPDAAAGVFTTLLVEDGVAVDLDRHLVRLAGSAGACYGAALPGDLTERLGEMITGLSGRNRLRITLVPGPTPRLVVARLEPSPVVEHRGSSWRLRPVVVPGGLGSHKYADRRRLEEVEHAEQPWTRHYDALLTDVDGSILETGRGNLFVVMEGSVRTPALDGRLLPGVTRQRAIEELSAIGVPVVESRVTRDELADATEVFVTSSIDRVRPVESIQSMGAWMPGPTTEWLSQRLSRPQAVASPPAPLRPASRLPGRGLKLLLIDNFDSFVYNLDQYVRELGASSDVVRNDSASVDEIETAVASGDYQGLIVSPGPGVPADAGISKTAIERLGPTLPILGVCLGHQCIAEVYGARVARAERILHGKQSLIHHDGRGVFAGLDGPLLAGRYHSLVVVEASLPADLAATAHTAGGMLMGIRHVRHRVEGVQIHPESILTWHGHQLLANFLQVCSLQPSPR